MSYKLELCFASNNENKLLEIRPLLEPDFSVLSLSDIGCNEDLEETESTLEGNSLQKAQYVFNNYGIPCFADDTGLEVEALNQEPGVYSARYAGAQRNSDDNIRLLLKNLAGLKNRAARFRTVITLVGIQDTRIFEGILEGTIGTEKKGDRGFGYDPVFYPAGYSKTLAEIDLQEKNKISHRAKAVEKLITWLKNYKQA